MNVNGLKIELKDITTSKHLKRFLVTDERGLPFGLVEKFKDDASTVNPWKAFKGIGHACSYLRAFYKNEGGKAAAVAAVVNSCNA